MQLSDRQSNLIQWKKMKKTRWNYAFMFVLCSNVWKVRDSLSHHTDVMFSSADIIKIKHEHKTSACVTSKMRKWYVN